MKSTQILITLSALFASAVLAAPAPLAPLDPVDINVPRPTRLEQPATDAKLKRECEGGKPLQDITNIPKPTKPNNGKRDLEDCGKPLQDITNIPKPPKPAGDAKLKRECQEGKPLGDITNIPKPPKPANDAKLKRDMDDCGKPLQDITNIPKPPKPVSNGGDRRV